MRSITINWYYDGHYFFLDFFMTCIVAVGHQGISYMAGDRGHSDANSITSANKAKVSKHGLYLFGYAGNAGLGQLIEHSFKFPPVLLSDINKHMITVFIPALKKFLSIHDYDATSKEENEGDLLIALKGKVYEINTGHWYCTEYEELAIGSGMQYAMGSLYTSKDLFDSQNKRVMYAVEAAISYSTSCKSPVDVIQTI
jgi:ATP-dependent protease HslVU (ClpYQ) peptidase subunit